MVLYRIGELMVKQSGEMERPEFRTVKYAG